MLLGSSFKLATGLEICKPPLVKSLRLEIGLIARGSFKLATGLGPGDDRLETFRLVLARSLLGRGLITDALPVILELPLGSSV